MLYKYSRPTGLYFLFFLLSIAIRVYPQVSISGPACGVAGSTGNYNAIGNISGVNNMQWCVSGGIILQAYGTNITGTNTCKTGTSVGTIIVQWNSVSSGSISLTTPVGNATNLLVTVVAVLNPGAISNTSQTIAYNSIPATLNTSTATNGYCTPSYQYQWQQSPDNSAWTDISGATSQHLSFSSAIIQTTYYRRRVLESNTSTYGYTNAATIYVNAAFTNLTITPSSQSIFTNGTLAGISLIAPATGGSCSGNYSYYWQTSSDGITYADNGTNGNVTFNPPGAVAGTKYYRIKVVCGAQTAFSNSAVVIISNHLATPPITPSSTTITYNTAPSFAVGSPTGGLCNGAYTYLWEKSPDNVNFTAVSTSSSYSSGNLTATTYFRRTVTCGSESVSATILVTVNSELFAGILAPGNISIPSGSSPGLISSSIANGGNCSNYNYTWQKSTDNITYTDITGTNNSLVYNSPAITVNTYYRMKVSCGIDIIFSKPVLVTIQPGAYTYNYVQTRQITAPLTTTEAAASSLTALRAVKQATQYFDGLGRPLQHVAKQASLITDPLNIVSSAGAVDLVSQSVYDELGRETYKYLPFASTAADFTKNDGNFKANPFQQQAAFYNDSYANNPLKGQGENYFFGQSNIELSPLNRPEKTSVAGNSWTGSSKGNLIKYWVNTTLDAVYKSYVNNSGAIGVFATYTITGTYPPGTLIKTATTDENNKQVIEFKDNEGKLLLKKVQLTGSLDIGNGSGYAGWLSTYYIYDNLNNLRCVIQPRGVELLANAGFNNGYPTVDASIIAEQSFCYEYDGRNRMIMKKVPGAAESYMVYDLRDRLVMTQDANLRSNGNKWLVTLYDNLNRPVQTGLLSNTYFGATPKTLAQHVNSATPPPPVTSFAPYPFDAASTPSVTYWEYLTKTRYDDYSTIPAASGLTAGLDAAYNTYLTGTIASPDYAETMPAAASSQTRGMPTWTETKVLGTTTYTYAVMLYDYKGRAIQTKSKNITSGSDINTIQYTWTGQPFINVLKQEKAGTPAQTSIIVSKMTYDDLGRMVKTEKKLSNTLVNGNAMSSYNTVSALEYDALGQLKKKKLGNKPGAAAGTPLVNLDYEYNIRGWLLSINKAYINNSINTDQYFGRQLGYDKDGILGTFPVKQYNGNISGTIWKSEGDQQKRKYDFTYDAVNRLLKADFNQYNGTAFDKSAAVDFSMQMGDGVNAASAYDANGNIKAMKQWGLILNTSPVIDDLTYNYKNTENSNKLLAVTESAAINTIDNKLGDFTDKNRTLDDYDYDVNGNLIYDKNKGISSITYNHLNLPLVITITSKGTITYTYDATGNKLRKVTLENASAANNNITTTTTATYLGGSVFETKTDNSALTADYTDQLQFMAHEEGRIRFRNSDNTLQYDYMLKDHLGNVRMVLTEEQQTNYYPATTLEGTYDASTNSMVNYEKTFYRIDNTKIIPETAVPSWPAETLANTKLYYNNNSSPSSNAAPVTPPNLSYPASCTPLQTDGSTKLYKLNAATNRTGFEFMIKVMAGDKIDIFGKSYFLNTATVNNANSTPLDLLTLMTNLLLSPANAAAGKGITATTLNSINTGQVPANFFRGSNGETTTIPKAYINYIFFDEQFKYAAGSASRVGSSGVVKDHWYVDGAQLSNITAPKNGYIFVYVSNESNLDVFFDNLQVIHKPGPILEETHYYPFGLTMSGISSKAFNFGQPKNQKEFNGIEHTTDLDLNQYDAFYRTLDPQTGRFLQIDPKIESAEAWSPYSAMLNNPIRNIDPLGDSTIPGAGFWRNAMEGLKDGARETGGFLMSLGTKEGWKNVGKAVVSSFTSTSEYDIATGTKFYEISTQKTAFSPENGGSKTISKDNVGYAIGYGLEKTAEAVTISKGVSAVGNVIKGAETQTVFRVFGGDAKAEGFSWTPKNPNTVSNFRDAAGLPSGGASGSNNTGRFVIEGTVKNENIIKVKTADPLDGNKGGLSEFIINPNNVNIKRVSGVNPQF